MPLVSLASPPGSEGARVVADLFGCFAVHNSVVVVSRSGTETLVSHWCCSLTHVPTGMSYLWGVTYEMAVAAAQEILNGPLDWSKVQTTADLTPNHKAQGKTLRQKYMGG